MSKGHMFVEGLGTVSHRLLIGVAEANNEKTEEDYEATQRERALSRLVLGLALMSNALAEAHRSELDGLLERVKRLEGADAERKAAYDDDLALAYDRGLTDGQAVGALLGEEEP